MRPLPAPMLDHLIAQHPELVTLVPVDAGFGASLYAAPNGTIVRVPRTIEAARRMTASVTVASLANLLPVAIPVPLWVDPPSGSLPFGAMAYARLPGRTMEPGDPTMAGDLARFLVALHAIDPAGVGFDSSALPDRTAVDTERRETMAIALPWLRSQIPATIHARLQAWWDRYQAFRANEPFRPAIVHGDFWYGNLLRNDAGAGLTGVLDWEQAALDDPAQDYATLLHSGQDVANQVLAMACDRSGQEIESMLRRRRWHWEYREFSGLAMSIVAGDAAEANESLGKLRTGALKSLFTRE